MNKIRLKILCFAFLLQTTTSHAQEKVIPYIRLSPLEKMELQIGLVEFKLEYSRSSMRGRNIFGGLEAYGNIWRTGANKNIKLSFNESIIANTDTLSAGTYTIFTKPGTDDWTIFFYQHIDRFGVPKNLDTFNIVSKLKVKPKYLKNPIETLDISFGNLTYGSGDIAISWEHVQIAIPFIIPYSSIIDHRLENQLNVMASDYATAANIYFDQKKDVTKAMEYLNLCTKTRENGKTFDQWLSNIKNKDLELPWAHFLKSKIIADRKDHKNAIIQANFSVRIAEAVGSKYYQRQNRANIEMWGKE